MAVTKYSSVVEMPEFQPLEPLDPENLRVACELSELSYGLHSWGFRTGVHKFGSPEDASAARKRQFARRARARSKR